jgi:transposase-like protein
MDDSNFIDIDGIKLWIVGAKNNITNNIRIDVFNTLTEEDVKLFIYNHIKPQNTIITDGLTSYNILNNIECPYLHEFHIHGPNGNFGFGSHSTNIIEGALGILQNWIKRIYGAIPGINFILYLREAEFRFMLSKYSNSEKENKIIEIFKYMYNSSDYELYDDDDELLDNNNYDY